MPAVHSLAVATQTTLTTESAMTSTTTAVATGTAETVAARRKTGTNTLLARQCKVTERAVWTLTTRRRQPRDVAEAQLRDEAAAQLRDEAAQRQLVVRQPPDEAAQRQLVVRQPPDEVAAGRRLPAAQRLAVAEVERQRLFQTVET